MTKIAKAKETLLDNIINGTAENVQQSAQAYLCLIQAELTGRELLDTDNARDET